MSLTALPTIPFIAFGVVEPVMLLMAWRLAFLVSPFDYYADQLPAHVLSKSDFQPQALGMSLQMGNIMLLLAFLAVFCCWTPYGTISRNYLAAVAVADWGHIYASYVAMGPEVFWDFKGWNGMAWGNIGVSAVLNILRLATVLGAFGPLEDELPEPVVPVVPVKAKTT